MAAFLTIFVLLGMCLASLATPQCPDYLEYSKTSHGPFSNGTHNLSFMRPEPICRSHTSPEVETLINAMQGVVSDPDLYRLFENTFPNTLDTAVKWRGYAANNTSEELTFLVTGDINAMWLRDSANQLLSYLPVLQASDDHNSLASLFRGAINLQARYLIKAPFCNSFHPPSEALKSLGINAAANDGARGDTVFPAYDNSTVWECKYELDSLAAFLTLSAAYANATTDYAFFAKFQWTDAVQAVLKTARQMMNGTYDEDGAVLASPYTFKRKTESNTETLLNNGAGSPVAGGTGLVRSAFRPSDDACMLPFLVPANMMFAVGLERCADLLGHLGQATGNVAVRDWRELIGAMLQMAKGIREGIENHGIVEVSGKRIFAYEVDGFGTKLVMDDANVPSLLAAPLMGYLDRNDSVYQGTRAAILDESGMINPYYMRGPAFSAVGGPHIGPGWAWPMASIVRILTSDDDDEITKELSQLIAGTAGLGLMHESVDSFDTSKWTRQWFSWVNGLFGQMIIDLQERKPGLLKQSFQNY